MADKPIVLSDVLCFIVNKFVNNDVKMVKAALSDFYLAADLHTAKMRLVGNVDKIIANTPVKRPHVPHRLTVMIACGKRWTIYYLRLASSTNKSYSISYLHMSRRVLTICQV